MKRARRFPQRLVRWTSLCVCFVLVLTSFVLFPSQVSIGKNTRSGKPSANSGAQSNGQERRVAPRPPQPGPPPGTLPNLDDMRSATDQWRRHGGHSVHAPDPIPSTQRRWRHGQQRAEVREQKSDVSNTNPTARANHARSGVVVPMPQGGSDMAMARIDPHNRTGTGGVDLLSNNFNWSLGLAGLKGRGLDLGLSLAYNSLAVWTVSGSSVAFDMDQGDPSPGFRLGFPTVQGPYSNSQTGSDFYILITPSGAHQELRRVGTSNVYQAVDASYSQLTVNSSNLVYLAGGAQLTFYPYPNPYPTEYHCTEIKDRNGNFLTINRNSAGDITTITDTLNRTLTFVYDSNSNLLEIDQTWNGSTHKWATFGWGNYTLTNNFSSSLSYGGPAPGTSIPILTSVGLPDASKYYFDYDTSYGVVTKIRYYANSNSQSPNERRQTTYTTSFTTTDSPRVTAERDWAASWNGDTDETPASGEEAVTTFSHDGSWCVATAPDGTIYKEKYGSGYQSGLMTDEEFWSNGVKKKWTTTTWTQENPNVSYLLNPRVTETNIYDAEYNRKRTVIDYSNSTYAAYSLPYVVIEYAADGSSLIRSTWFDYKLDQQYLDKRIIGLLMWEHVYDHIAGAYAAKTTYGYDESSTNTQATTATQHDQSYTSSVSGRANVTSVSRWDVTDINNGNKAHTNHMTYDAAGSVLTTSDPLGHTTKIEYADTYAYAYPTQVKDPDYNESTAPYDYSTAQYNFDTGAVTQTQGARPSGQSAAMAQSMSYDSVGRLQWITRSDDGFWKYIAYADRGDAIMSQVSLTAYPDSAWSITVVDGADRTRLVGHDLPNSTGGYAGAFTYYDNMGRVSLQSNVEETNSSWSPAGDDSAGWVVPPYPTVYDWKGRPTRTYNTDGTHKDASYDGCGCAGGQVVTLTDEVGRQQNVYSDSLGRQWKIEVLNSNSSVYSTTTNTLDALDHVTQVTQTDNATSVNQVTTMGYDGYGRLHTRHAPEQQVDTNNSSSTDHTTYTYNDDDTVHVVTDARGAMATYSYNNRHLVTGIAYAVPSGSGITAPGSVSFDYDAAGNRTYMSDGTGSCTYSYDTLSRMTSETHHFNDLASSSTSGNYTLSYAYNLGSELTSITDGFSTQVGYIYDSTGRLTTVTNSGASNFSSQYLSNIEYRAWGAMKYVNYGNGAHAQASYNSRLLPTSYSVSNVSKSYPFTDSATLSWTYDYYDDGRVHHAYDGDNNKWDRSYAYDHAARISEADTNKRARGQSPDYWHPDPYQQTFGYDVFNHSASRSGYLYSSVLSDSGSYTNNRRSGWTYDADGNTTVDSSYTQTFDGAGQYTNAVASRTVGDGSTQWPNQPQLEITQSYDGGGQSVKRNQITRMNDHDLETGEFTGVEEDNQTRYYLRSSVLGGAIIDEMLKDSQNNAQKTEGYVYAGVQKIAKQVVGQYTHDNPVTGSWLTTNASNRYAIRQERDPVNGTIPLDAPPSPSSYLSSNFGGALFIEGGDPADYSSGITIDGMPATQADVDRGRENGSIEPCHNNDCGAHSVTVTGKGADGSVVGTHTILVLPGQTGWDGSLDGTYQAYGHETLGFDSIGSNPLGFLRSLTALDAHGIGEFDGAAFQRVSGPQNTGQVSLTGKNLERYNDQRDKTRDKLQNSDKCRKFLLAHGIDPDAALDAVNQQRAYDGAASTISRLAAGIVNPEVNITSAVGSAFANAPISNSFTNNRGPKIEAWTAFYVGGAFNTTVSGRSDVYFRSNGLNASTILHEALHSLFGIADPALAAKLGVTVTEDDTSAISNVLHNHDCGG
jgi:YD repeat-containing protein